MKIINLSDIHISGKNPICRKDDLTELQFVKLREVINLSNDLNAPIICNGDVTNIPNLAYSLYNRLSKELRRLNNDFYFVIGQHDLWWHTLETFGHTALGALYENLLNVKHISEFESFQYGFAYLDWGELIGNKDECFLVSHRPIITRKNNHRAWIKANPDHCLQWEMMKQYQLILCGDWHKPYIHKKLDDLDQIESLLINPGCLCRRDANEDNEHNPHVVIIELDTLEYEKYFLKCAKEYDEVISESHLELTRTTREIRNSMSNIVDIINKSKVVGNVSGFLNLLIQVLDENIDEELKQEIRDSLKRVIGEKISFGAEVSKLKLKRRD
jgi:predicted phosphodiesterase